MAAPDELDDRLLRVTLQRAHRGFRRPGGLGAVAQAVHDGHEPALRRRGDQAPVTGLGLPGQDELRDGPLDHPGAYRFHLRAVTVVPLPKSEAISNSSMSRWTPGKPSPRLPDVEYPSCMASVMSGIPGPSPVATTSTPRSEEHTSELQSRGHLVCRP